MDPKCLLCVSAKTYLRASSKLAVTTETSNKASTSSLFKQLYAGVEKYKPHVCCCSWQCEIKRTAKLSTYDTRGRTSRRHARYAAHAIRDVGCRVVEACNGLEAVEAASRKKLQLILMDGRLPFMDGFKQLAAFVKMGSRIKLRLWRSMALRQVYSHRAELQRGIVRQALFALPLSCFIS